MSTIAEVAKEAGVSVASVSRVINDSSCVSIEMIERVNRAIDKLNYQPNIWGRRLRRKESRMILVFVPNIQNPYYASIVSGIEDAARYKQYGMILCITDSDKAKEKEFLELLQTGQADGAIMMTIEKDDLSIVKLAQEIPLVQCCEYCSDEGIAHVSVDNFAAGKQIVEYLISLGHRRIGFIGSINQFISSEERQKGYEKALAEAGIAFDSRYFSYADKDYNFSSGVRAAKELLLQSERPTAIFCVSDVLALGALRAAQSTGFKCSRDLSVVGFDDVEYATMFQPMLTTVSQPRYLMGKTSANMLIQMIETGNGAAKVYLDHQLILRESTAVLSQL